MDCSLKIDDHQVLKPFNEQFLSIIQQFQTFQLDPSEVRDQWTFIMKMPPQRLTGASGGICHGIRNKEVILWIKLQLQEFCLKP